jgi:hypothetical protein
LRHRDEILVIIGFGTTCYQAEVQVKMLIFLAVFEKFSGQIKVMSRGQLIRREDLASYHEYNLV